MVHALTVPAGCQPKPSALKPLSAAVFLHQATTTTTLALVSVFGCSFGNSVEDSDAAFSFTAQAEGPGPVDAVVDSTQAGPARLELLARHSGTYSLMLVSNLQEALGSGPIQLNCDCRLPLGCSQGKLLCLVPFHKAHSSALCLSTRQIALHCAFTEGNLVCIVPFHQANSSAPACLAFHLSVLSQLMHWLLQHTMCPVHVSAETSDNACESAAWSVMPYSRCMCCRRML